MNDTALKETSPAPSEKTPREKLDDAQRVFSNSIVDAQHAFMEAVSSAFDQAENKGTEDGKAAVVEAQNIINEHSATVNAPVVEEKPVFSPPIVTEEPNTEPAISTPTFVPPVVPSMEAPVTQPVVTAPTPEVIPMPVVTPQPTEQTKPIEEKKGGGILGFLGLSVEPKKETDTTTPATVQDKKPTINDFLKETQPVTAPTVAPSVGGESQPASLATAAVPIVEVPSAPMGSAAPAEIAFTPPASAMPVQPYAQPQYNPFDSMAVNPNPDETTVNY